MLLWQGRNLWLLSNKGQIGGWWKGHSPTSVASWPASAQHLVLSDSAFAFWVPHPRCVAAPDPGACCESHYLPSTTPPYPLLTREAELYTAARPALRPWRCAQHLGTSSQSSLVPTPWSSSSPCSQGHRSCQARGANSARSAGVPLLPLCVRASRVGAEGEEGRSLSICLPRLCPGRSKCSVGGGGSPRAGAGNRGTPRFQQRSGSGAAVGKAGTVRAAVPSSHPATSASLRPCHPDARSGARPGAERDGEHE